VARTLTLQSCLHDHEARLFVHCAIVMPDHVHMIFVPLVDKERPEVVALATITQAIKGASAHRINRSLGRKGAVWQDESLTTSCVVPKPWTRKSPTYSTIQFGQAW